MQDDLLPLIFKYYHLDNNKEAEVLKSVNAFLKITEDYIEHKESKAKEATLNKMLETIQKSLK